MALTPRQQAFTQEYLRDLNGAQAAIRAGYSAKTARAIAEKLMRLPAIQEAVQAARAARQERLEIDADRVLTEIAGMALYDAGEIGAHAIAGPKDIASLPVHLRRSIVGWSWDRQGRFTLKLADKIRAAELLARHLGLLQDRVELTGRDGGPVELRVGIRQELEARYGLAPAAPASGGGGDAAA